MVDQITNHEERLLSLLTSQFEGQDNIEGLVKVIAKFVQNTEDAAWQLATDRALSTSAGSQLDGIGDILGEDRNGRSDADYRSALGVRIKINLSSGQPETLISVLAALTDAGEVQYSEVYPATAQLFSDGDEFPPDLLDNLYQVAPAAVALILTVGTTNPFVMEGDTDGEGLAEKGYGTYGGELVEKISS